MSDEGKYTPTTLVLGRDAVLKSTKGHSIRFKKGVPTHVPPAIYQEALAMGGVSPDGKMPDIKEPPKTDKAPSDVVERFGQVMKAIKALVAENSRNNFNAGGSPTSSAVSRLVGYKVDSKEISTVWQAYHDEIAADKEAKGE